MKIVLVLFLSLFTTTAAMADADLAKVKNIVSRWNSDALKSIDIAVVESESDSGVCWYNAEEVQVEVAKSALEYSEENLARCLAPAFAHARYEDIESRWLSMHGEHEAWIIKNGNNEKVAIEGNKLATPAARALWVSLATQALLKPEEPASSETGRRLASGSSDQVRKLLGIESSK